MLEWIGMLLAGVAIGAYAGVVGIGGGILLAPLLLIRYPNAAPEEITTATLTVVLVLSSASTVMAVRRQRIDYKLAGVLAMSVVPISVAGAAATVLLPRAWFAFGFGVLLISIAAALIRNPVVTVLAPVRGSWARHHTDRGGATFDYRVPLRPSLVVAAAAAGLSALVGIGGGLLYAPLATRVMRTPHTLAVPLAHVLIATVSLAAVTFHLVIGHLGDPQRDVLPLLVGGLIALPIAMRIHDRVGERALTRALAAGMFLVGLQTAIFAF